jgi:hypothetical protein
VTRGLIVEANLRAKPEQIQRIVDLYLPVRQAWKQVEEEMSRGKSESAVPGLDSGRVALASPTTEISDLDGERAQWNA